MKDFVHLVIGEGAKEKTLDFGYDEDTRLEPGRCMDPDSLRRLEDFLGEARGPIHMFLSDPYKEHSEMEKVTLRIFPDMPSRLTTLYFCLLHDERYREIPALGVFLKEVGLEYVDAFPVAYAGKFSALAEYVRTLTDSENLHWTAARGSDGMLHVFDLKRIHDVAEGTQASAPEQYHVSQNERLSASPGGPRF